MGRRYPLLFMLLTLLVLSGCKTELYSNLGEQETNQMLAVLLAQGIQADKKPGKENRWTLEVEARDVSKALEVLQAEGLPRKKYKSMGQIFQKTGLVSSPLEERVRYIYALSQDLADTISLIDGVIVAKVHIVLPENDPFSQKTEPSSASVFIKCRSLATIASNIPKIKKLIVNSIEGLTYDKVTVVPFVQVRPELAKPPRYKELFGLQIAPSSYNLLVGLLAGMGLLILILMGLLGWFVLYPKLKGPAKDESSEE